MSLKEVQDRAFAELETLSPDSSVSLVPACEDYGQDDSLCLTMIWFPDKELKTAILDKVIEPLRQADPKQFYYSEKSLHMTIQSVRVVATPKTFTEEDINKVKSLKIQGAYIVNLNGLFRMPSSIGVRGYPKQEAVEFTLGLRRELKAIGVPDDKNYVHPSIIINNITVCRLYSQPSPEFEETFKSVKDVDLGTVSVDKISLVETNSVCSPSKTRVLHTFKLTKHY